MIDKTYIATDIRLRYRSPEVNEIPLTVLNILCVSNPDGNTTEMEEGDNNW